MAKDTATRLLLIRHGESVLGAQGRYAGHFDTPLTPRGREEIRHLKRRYRRFHVRRIYSSDLRRCRETARILDQNTDIIMTKQLRELHFGSWEGRTAEECARRFPSRYPRWLRNPSMITPPDGESLEQLSSRIQRVIRKIAQGFAGQTIAIVTHGGPIRVLRLTDLQDFWAVHVPTASLTVHRWRELGEEAL